MRIHASPRDPLASTIFSTKVTDIDHPRCTSSECEWICRWERPGTMVIDAVVGCSSMMRTHAHAAGCGRVQLIPYTIYPGSPMRSGTIEFLQLEPRGKGGIRHQCKKIPKAKLGSRSAMIGAGADASISVYHRHQAQCSPTSTRDSKRQKSQIARIFIQQFHNGRRKKSCHTHVPSHLIVTRRVASSCRYLAHSTPSDDAGGKHIKGGAHSL
jgi:hypothetical protein